MFRIETHRLHVQWGPPWATKPASAPQPRSTFHWLSQHTRIIKDAVKGGLAPVFGRALFQYHPFASNYEDLGFLVGIMTILSRCYQPRAHYAQRIAYSAGGACLGSCIALLSAYCARKLADTQVVPVRRAERTARLRRTTPLRANSLPCSCS